jgi:gliding motility-associated-like protein
MNILIALITHRCRILAFGILAMENHLTQLAPTYKYKQEGIYDITLKVVSKYGCIDTMVMTQAVEVIQSSSFILPQAFTPNPSGGSGGSYNPQDRSNDVFYPIITDGELFDYEFTIYNRDGVMVFKSNDTQIGWDGYYKGKLLPQVIYIWSVTGKYNSGRPFSKIGNVLLIVKDN